MILEPAGERVAVDRGDQRDRAIEDHAEGALEQRMLGEPLRVRHAVALFEVAAAAERLGAGAGQHDAARLVGIGDQAGEHIEQVAAHLGVDRVRDLRPVERHDQQMIGVRLDLQGLVVVAHRGSSRRAMRAARAAYALQRRKKTIDVGSRPVKSAASSP
jgi:hypothetical protein